mmetsp:Transcript_42498/g.77122  ORF Transcript_42498/g.77122 Transcript_42498/m.77122 type:complete len:719 (+) Transcript_42498:55-2211(+)
MKYSPHVQLLVATLLLTQAHAISPITRAVELMKGLATKVEMELKSEEDLYEKYVCWATTVINSKKQSNADADARITELEAYIEDLDAGRVELTSERQDLTAELKGINADMENSKAMREQEHEDFLNAKDEMEKAIAALSKSIEVLSEATKDHQDGVFMSVKQQSASESNLMAELDTHVLERALALTAKALDTSDAEFLQKLLTGDVPTWDWKKLNRDATFKMKYKARSSRIMEVLQELKETFTTNLAQAEAAEAKSQSDYDKITNAKGAQKGATSDSLNKMEVEGAARGESKMSASEELQSLKDQKEADLKFISDTEAALATKKEEWKTRKVLRQGEIEALNKAVAILHSDDNRDLFKRSFKSQGTASFLQLKAASARSLSASRSEAREFEAVRTLQAAAAKSGDARLKQLAEMLSASKAAGHFDAVIEAIDKMIAFLKKEEAKDLSIKEQCEKERAENARTAVVAARTIDEHTDTIARLKVEIEELVKKIEVSEAEIADIKKQLDEAARIRADEHAEWQKSDADDAEAAEVVEQAMQVLKDFYEANGLAFLQGRQIPKVVAGEAPPPPPPTWEAPYAGALGEQDGIVAILGLIKEDILKDQEKAKAEEDAAEKAYQTFVADSTSQIRKLEASIASMEGQKGEKEQSIESHLDLRLTKKSELDDVLSTMKEVTPGCNFATINYPVRVSNRQIELDGLYRAKTILMGALSGAPAPAPAL